MKRSATVHRIWLALMVPGMLMAAGPAAAQRLRMSMDPGWRFTLGDPAGAERTGFDDRMWRRLDLPHDWSSEGTPREDAPAGGRGGYFPTGIGWYRKAFRLPAGPRNRQVRLEFDGVHMNSDVWINGVHLGRRPYGYASFSYDITAHLVSGVNVVALRVDNSLQPNSRWYTGSGLYRHVCKGRGLAILRATQPGTLVLTAGADGVRPATMRVQVLRGKATDMIPPAR